MRSEIFEGLKNGATALGGGAVDLSQGQWVISNFQIWSIWEQELEEEINVFVSVQLKGKVIQEETNRLWILMLFKWNNHTLWIFH